VLPALSRIAIRNDIAEQVSHGGDSWPEHGAHVRTTGGITGCRYASARGGVSLRRVTIARRCTDDSTPATSKADGSCYAAVSTNGWALA